MSRRIAIIVALALAGCSSPEERRANAAFMQERWHQDRIDQVYDRCINRVVGAFSSASIEVMKECERQSRLAP